MRLERGDFVRVGPSRKGKRDGFVGKVIDVELDDAGAVHAVHVLDADRKHRFLRPERVHKMRRQADREKVL